jgi:hypothetical protein
LRTWRRFKTFFVISISLFVIASEAKQSIYPLCREMDCFRLRSLSYGGQVASLAMTP